MGGGIGQLEIVHRIHDPSSEEMAPDAVDDGLGKLGPVGGGHPIRQAGPWILKPVLPARLSGKEGRANLRLVARVDHRPALSQHAMPFGIVHDDVVGGRARVDVSHPGQLTVEGGHAPELVLTPGLVGVVVALGAVQPPAQKDPHLLAHHVLGRGQISPDEIVVQGRTAVALSRDTLAGHLVVGLVAGNPVPNPFPVEAAVLGKSLHRLADPEEIGKPEGPMVQKLG